MQAAIEIHNAAMSRTPHLRCACAIGARSGLTNAESKAFSAGEPPSLAMARRKLSLDPPIRALGDSLKLTSSPRRAGQLATRGTAGFVALHRRQDSLGA